MNGRVFVTGLRTVLAAPLGGFGPAEDSVQHGREIGAGRLVVEPNRHQRHHLNYAQTMGQTPLEQRRIAHRHEDARPAERFYGADQRHQVEGGLPDGVRKEGQIRGVAGDAILMFHDPCSALRDGVEQFAAAVMAVDRRADTIAGLEVGRDHAPNRVARKHNAHWRALYARDRFSRMKAERRVERERPRMVGGLEKTDAGTMSLGRSVQGGPA
jgi:hypothetical protein